MNAPKDPNVNVPPGANPSGSARAHGEQPPAVDVQATLRERTREAAKGNVPDDGQPLIPYRGGAPNTQVLRANNPAADASAEAVKSAAALLTGQYHVRGNSIARGTGPVSADGLASTAKVSTAPIQAPGTVPNTDLRQFKGSGGEAPSR